MYGCNVIIMSLARQITVSVIINNANVSAPKIGSSFFFLNDKIA